MGDSPARSSVAPGRWRADRWIAFRTAVGTLAVAWSDVRGRVLVERIYLPLELPAFPARSRRRGSCAEIDRLAKRIASFCAGEPIDLDRSLLDLEACPAFQRAVLVAEHGIPRGRVSTYGRIARHIGHPGAARAVGTALGTNPFPLVIPCHRAVREGGALGGYRGGLPMKRLLLELEGVAFDGKGRVIMDRVWYGRVARSTPRNGKEEA